MNMTEEINGQFLETKLRQIFLKWIVFYNIQVHRTLKHFEDDFNDI